MPQRKSVLESKLSKDGVPASVRKAARAGKMGRGQADMRTPVEMLAELVEKIHA